MRLVFDDEGDDEVEFGAARDALMERFEAWLVDMAPGEPVDELVAYAGTALNWKWGYADGHLARWDRADVYEFLLEWCPRKLSVSQAESAPIPVSLVALVTFLDAEGLLASGSSAPDEFAAAVGSVADEFVVAMGDPSKFGMAKSLFTNAAAEGFDVSDPDQMEEWIAEFNSRPVSERDQVIGGGLSGPSTPTLPPVGLPDEETLEASKEEAPILAVFARLAAFVGDGRKLTQTGKLTLADARELVDLLGTGDEMDAQIGDKTFKTRSSDDLPRLRQVFAWAKKAGVLRVVRGRIVATKAGRVIADDPAAHFDRAVDALFAIGPLASQRYEEGWFSWPEVNELLDEVASTLLAGPYVTQRALPIDDLADVATDMVFGTFEFPDQMTDHVPRRVLADVTDMMDAFELAGVVQRMDIPEPSEDDAGRRRWGGSVDLTPAGVVVTHSLLTERGYDAPTEGQFTEATATELFLGTDQSDFPTFMGEVVLWRRHREPLQAAEEVAAAVRELDDPGLKNLALSVLGEMGDDVAGPQVRRLATDPATRGFALCWLVDNGLAEASELYDPDDVGWFVDVLAHRLVDRGEEGLLDTLALAGDDKGQITAIKKLWRSPSAATDSVLAAIGDLHPSKSVAKTAQKARFQRRSWTGGNSAP